MSLELDGIAIEAQADGAAAVPDGMLLRGAEVAIELPFAPVRFYRHGWQSWSLTTWQGSARASRVCSWPSTFPCGWIRGTRAMIAPTVPGWARWSSLTAGSCCSEPSTWKPTWRSRGTGCSGWSEAGPSNGS